MFRPAARNQAFNAILFFYNQVLEQPLGKVDALRDKETEADEEADRDTGAAMRRPPRAVMVCPTLPDGYRLT